MSVCQLFAAFVLLVLSLQVSAEQENPETEQSSPVEPSDIGSRHQEYGGLSPFALLRNP